MRRSNHDARGNTTDFEYIYMRNPSDRRVGADQRQFLVVVEAHSEPVFDDAETAHCRNTEVTVM